MSGWIRRNHHRHAQVQYFYWGSRITKCQSLGYSRCHSEAISLKETPPKPYNIELQFLWNRGIRQIVMGGVFVHTFVLHNFVLQTYPQNGEKWLWLISEDNNVVDYSGLFKCCVLPNCKSQFSRESREESKCLSIWIANRENRLHFENFRCRRCPWA